MKQKLFFITILCFLGVLFAPTLSSAATPLTPAQSTTGFGPNAYGCSTTTDVAGRNLSYCMLAPLPIVDKDGKIDPTGKLDVSMHFGDYLKGVIKLIMGLIMVFAVLMCIVGGIEYMSTVQVGEKEGAKARILNALGGVVLALSSYIILNTINPKLVDLSVNAPEAVLTLGDEGEEYDSTPLVVPSDTSPNIAVAIPSDSAQNLAKLILQNANITLSPQWGSQDAKSTVIQNITDTSVGKPAWTSPSKQGGQSQAALDPRMLGALLAIGNNAGKITVSEITGGKHSAASAHYSGLAFDIEGSSFSYNVATGKKIMDICKAAGAKPRQIFGPCNGLGANSVKFIECPATGHRVNKDHENHVHCGW